MAEDDPKQKMRAFDDEVAIAIAQLYLVHMLQSTLPAGFIAPCLPTKTDKLPSGSQWLHEIKHDGFRIIARKKGAQVRLYSRPDNDLTRRFPLIVETLARLRSQDAGGPRAEQAGKVEARLLLSRSEGRTVARAGRNACAPLSAHVGSIGFSEDLRPRGHVVLSRGIQNDSGLPQGPAGASGAS
jgi:hypothetical protein